MSVTCLTTVLCLFLYLHLYVYFRLVLLFVHLIHYGVIFIEGKPEVLLNQTRGGGIFIVLLYG